MVKSKRQHWTGEHCSCWWWCCCIWCLLINYLLHKHNNQLKVINLWLEAAREEKMAMETAENKWKSQNGRRRRKIANRIQWKSVQFYKAHEQMAGVSSVHTHTHKCTNRWFRVRRNRQTKWNHMHTNCKSAKKPAAAQASICQREMADKSAYLDVSVWVRFEFSCTIFVSIVLSGLVYRHYHRFVW